MLRRSFVGCVAVVPWALLTVTLSGCGQAAPENVTNGEASADLEVAPPANNSAPASSSASSDFTIATAGTAAPRVITPTIVATATPPSPIGPGHFHGRREAVVTSSSAVRALIVSPNGRFVVVGRQVNENGGLLQVWDVAAGQLISETWEPLGVTAVAFDPDSQTVAYGAADHSIVVQPIPQGPTSRWNGHRLSIRDLAFSPDGNRLASVGNDKRLIVWDVAGANIVAEATHDHPNAAARVRFLSPNRLWTWGESGMLQWYDLKSNSLAPGAELKLSENLWPVACDGQKLYGLQPDRTLRIVDTTTGRDLPAPMPGTSNESTAAESLPVSGRNITAIAVATTSQDLAVCSTDGELTLWGRSDSARKQSWNLGVGYVNFLATDENGRIWAAHTAAGGLLVFDRDQPDSPRWLEQAAIEDRGPRLAARFCPSGEAVVSMRGSKTVILALIKTGVTQRRIARHDGNDVTALCASRNNVVICGTSAGAVERWNTNAPTPTSVSVTEAAITALAETPDGKHLLVGDADGATSWIGSHQVGFPTPRREQTARIRAAEISPDGRWAATASDDQTVVLWDVAQQSRVFTFRGHRHPVQAAAFSSDSNWLVSGDQQGTVIIWDILKGVQTWSVTLPAALAQPQHRPSVASADTFAKVISQFVFGPATANIAANSDAQDAPAPTRTSPSQAPGSSATATETDAAAEIVRAAQSAVIESLDTPSIEADGGISAVAFSGDQRVLAVGTAAGYTQTFDLTHGRELSAVHHQAPISDLAFANDGASLLVATPLGNVSRWWQAPANPRLLSGHQGSARFAALDASGRRAVTGGTDKRLCIWDVEQASLLQSLDNEGEVIVSGALSPDGSRAVTGGYGTGVVFWDLVARKRLIKRYGHGKRVLSLAFSPDGNWVASGCEDQTVKIWDFASQKTKQTIAHDAPVHFVTFSPDGAKLLTSTIDPRGWQFPSRLRLWETATGKPLSELQGHRVTVNAAVFSSDGRDLMSCGADGHLCRWALATGKRIYDSYRSDGLSHAGLINNGQLLVMRRFNNGVIIHDAGSLARLSEFDVPTRSVGDLSAATNGNRVIAGTEEGPVYVWDITHE